MLRRTLTALIATGLLVAVTSGGCAKSGASAQPAKPSLTTTDLFNGKNLDGWRYYLADHNVGMNDVWSVRDGVLVCKGEPIGYLYTTQQYKNFRIVVEWRWAPGTKPGNSGVLMRIHGKPQPLPQALEAQLMSGSAGDFYGIQGVKIAGDPSRMKSIPNHELGGLLTGVTKIKGAEKEPGQWNTYEIELNGGNLKASVNGQLVNEATGAEPGVGPIGLQSEGGEIHFRKVQITPLAD